jgi:predicted outer membrane lipoprotein
MPYARRLILIFGAVAFLVGLTAVTEGNYLAGIPLLLIGVPASVLPVARMTLLALSAWRQPAYASAGSFGPPWLRRGLKAAGFSLTLLGLVAIACAFAVLTAFWVVNHEDPPFSMVVLMAIALIPAGIAGMLGYGLLLAGRSTIAGDRDGVESGFRLGWILFVFCAILGGSPTDDIAFWRTSALFAIPIGVITLLTCLGLMALRKPMSAASSQYWAAKRAGRLPQQQAGRPGAGPTVVTGGHHGPSRAG